MNHVRPLLAVAAVLLTAGIFIGAAHGQQPPTTSQPTTQPAALPEGATAITAVVIEVRGDCKHAPLGSQDWQACEVGDEYPQQTVILTGIRSALKLRIGTDDTHTAVNIEPASKTLLAEAYTTADTKRVNIGVGYGRIRAGVVEGGLKSDFTVESPVATLSKRGTWNFGLAYERGTDRFEIFLLDRGLVDAFSKVTGQHRGVLPGELVTDVMRRWFDEVQFLRNVPIPDIFGQGTIDVAFNRLQTDGLRVLGPEGGTTVFLDLSGFAAQQEFAQLASDRMRFMPLTTGSTASRARAEGFFGTGRGEELIPLTIGEQTNLAKQGLARPGTYRFRRSALEDWLRGYQKRK